MKRLRYLILSVFALFFICLIPIRSDSNEYVRDDYGVLYGNEEIISLLNERAQSLSNEHECGIYIRVFPDTQGFYDVEEFSEYIYKGEDLGYGPEKNGVMLLLAMDDRSYDVLAYGNKANRAFTDHAKDVMVDAFIPYLRDNDYYSAFNEFISQADEKLLYEEAGTPFDYDTDPVYIAQKEAEEARRKEAEKSLKTGVTFGLPGFVGLLTCLGLKGKNKTTGLKHDASGYVLKNSFRLTQSTESFMYSTRVVTHIPDKSDGGGHSGGTSINSGGFSHSSGHF